MKLVLLLLVCFVISVIGGRVSPLPDYVYDDCPGTENSQSIWSGSPALVSNITNGIRYSAGFANDSQPLNVVHVWGTPYEMGLATGTLMAKEISGLIPEMFDYVHAMIGKYIGFLPSWLQQAIEIEGVNFLLDLTYNITAPYTDQYFYDELKGLADGSGVPYQQLARLSMFPEATSMACSIIGANGPAVAAGTGLLQLRALDWGGDAPTANFPLLLVYHPNEGNGHQFAQLGWPGMVGAVTGVSEYLFQSEKVWDHSNSKNPRAGIPATFLIRNILQFDQTLDDALSRIANANRTCSFFLGLGERETGDFKLVENSYEHVFNFSWSDFPAYDGHPIEEGLVWVDKHTQPSKWGCMQSIMNSTYGMLTSDVIIQQVTALAQTGDQHIAVFDEANNAVYIAVAAAATSDNSTAIPAYNRPFLRFDIAQLFSESRP